MQETDNNKKFPVKMASEEGAFMGKEMEVPLGQEITKPTPGFKVPETDYCEPAPKFTTNTGNTNS